jgi:hypothetical protein
MMLTGLCCPRTSGRYGRVWGRLRGRRRLRRKFKSQFGRRIPSIPEVVAAVREAEGTFHAARNTERIAEAKAAPGSISLIGGLLPSDAPDLRKISLVAAIPAKSYPIEELHEAHAKLAQPCSRCWFQVASGEWGFL